MEGSKDWIHYPYAAIDELFEEHHASGRWEQFVKDFVHSKIADTSLMKKVPFLNIIDLHKLTDGQVVRFRGIIQDMFDNEFFLDKYEARNLSTKIAKIKPGRYRDIVYCGKSEEIIPDSEHSKTSDRILYYCTPIPGENEWVKQSYRTQIDSFTEERETSSVGDGKRSYSDVTEGDQICEERMETSDETEMKRLRSADNIFSCSENIKSKLSMVDLNFPIPGMTGNPCIAKLYEDDNFSINDVVEFVGILSLDPCLVSDSKESSSVDLELDDAMHSLPPSVVPRLHVLSAKKLSHINPFMPSTQSNDDNILKEELRETRELLRKVLEEVLMGDSLAAELMICHLISGVYLRQDYKSNRLVSGMLQLCSQTHLTVDETAMSVGQLDVAGVLNMKALAAMITWQKVDYDFQFHTMEVLTDVPVIVLSEGRSLLKCDTEIRLQPRSTDVAGCYSRAKSLLTNEALQQIRIYLTQSHLTQYSLSDDMQQMVQEDFVESRQNSNGLTADDLHNLLILSRLLALSCGEVNLTPDIWNSAKILENERILRLS